MLDYGRISAKKLHNIPTYLFLSEFIYGSTKSHRIASIITSVVSIRSKKGIGSFAVREINANVAASITPKNLKKTGSNKTKKQLLFVSKKCSKQLLRDTAALTQQKPRK